MVCIAFTDETHAWVEAFDLVLFGATAAGLWKEEALTVIAPGESVTLAGYEYRLDSVEQIAGPNYASDWATFTVTKDSELIAALTPELLDDVGLDATEARHESAKPFWRA